jgi:hypothetical protein
MVLELATWVLTALAGYVALGALFALASLVSDVQRLAPDPAPMTLPTRLLIVPGLVLLWPLLVLKWNRSSRPPDRELAKP